MASFENYQKVSFVKGLYLGDSGAGKTTSIVSLIENGYKVRVFDFDNLLTPLFHAIQRKCPDKLKNLSYQIFTDKMKGVDMPGMMQGKVLKVMPMVDGQATAFSSALKQLNRWKDGEEDLGVPAQWGKDTVVVIDTLTTMASAAFRYCEALNPLALEPQATYFAAQRMIANVLALLASDSFATNVLVLAHVDYDKNQLDITRGFPRAIGSAMRTQIAPFFSCVLLAEDQKWLKTRSTGIVDLKNPVSFKVDERLPLDSGLATFFRAVTD